ncbi:MAG: hypothetical protein WBE92_02280 [Steroidobacteraceae bacterium]
MPRQGKLRPKGDAIRRIAGALLLLAAAGSARAQMLPGLGGVGVGGSWLGAGQPLQGAGFLTANAGIAYLDNAGLTATNQQGDEVASTGLGVNYNRTGRELDITAFGDLDWLQYLNPSTTGEPFGNFLARASWGKPSDLFQWNLQDTFGEAQENPLAAPTVTNEEYFNSVSTGPRLNFNLSTSTSLNIHGLYQNMDYQNSPFNAQSYDGGAGFTLALSRISSLSLALDDVRTQYNEEGIAPTYDTRTASLSYSAKFSRTQFAVSAGYTDVNYTDTWSGAPIFSANVTRQLGPYSTLFVSGQTGYTTLGESMTGNLETPAGASVLAGGVPYGSSPAPFKEQFGSLGWDFNRLRTSLALAASIGREQYEQTPGVSDDAGSSVTAAFEVDPTMELVPEMARDVRPLDLVNLDQSTAIDNTFETYSASLTRKLSSSLQASLRAYVTDSRYGNLGASTLWQSYSFELTQKFGRTAVSAYAAWIHDSTSGADSGLAATGYKSTVVGLTVSYNLLAPKSPTGE